MSPVHRAAPRATTPAKPFQSLAIVLHRALTVLRFATSSTTAADWRKWTEVHTPRKTQPG
jgi:hypothetical protein